MRLLIVSLLTVAALAGCGGDAPSATPAPPVTVTATVTETATAVVSVAPGPTPGDPTRQAAGDRSAEPLPQLRLEVFSDGCGVVRSDDPPGATYRNLTWVFRDQDGFQVLGRLAEGETRYRHFGAGTYDVVLEAFGEDHYVPVSNEVTVRC